MQEAIALPILLMDMENHVTVLVIFFVLFLIVIPSIVLCWYTESNKYDKRGIHSDNFSLFYHQLGENFNYVKLIDILTLCTEFQKRDV